MSVWIYVFVGILVAAFAIAIASQVIGPSHLRRKFTEEMARRGWLPVTPEGDAAWTAFADLAAHGAFGPEARFEYEVARTVGRETGSIRKRQKAVPVAPFRDPGSRHPRFAATGSRTEVEHHDARMAGLSSPTTSWSKAHELWVGEVRPLPVDAPRIVFSSLHEIARGMPQLAANPSALGAPPLLEGDLAERVRALLRERQALLRFGPTVHVGPAAWVLVTLIEKSMPRLPELLDLASEISRTLDGEGRGPAPPGSVRS